MIAKWTIIGFLATTTAFWEVFCLGHWDSETNHGFTFGYWRPYNNIRTSLAQIPRVRIVGTGYNNNVTLREFDFDVITTNGVFLKLWFDETDPIRQMTGDQLSRELSKKIDREYIVRTADECVGQ